MACILALDQSTSATKALLFDRGGRCLDRESRDHRQYYPQPGWVEHDAEEIWQNVLVVLKELVRRNRAWVGEIACLSIANQRETVVAFSKATGRPLHPAIVWQCRRGDSLCEAQKTLGRADAVHQRTGLPIDSYFSASKLQWMVRTHPELASQLASGEALLGTIDAYLIYRLTSGAVFATDPTNASRTLLYDIVGLRWDEELCRWWDVPRAALPEVRESFASFGATTLEGSLVRPLPICGVMGDSQASLFGQGCWAVGDAKVTFGTGSSILLNTGAEPRFSERGVVTALAWVQGGVPTYALEGIIISSASALAWLRDRLALIADFADAEAMATAVADNDGVYLVPAFSGLGLPYWRSDARAAIVGLSGHSDRRHLVRASLESIAYQLCDAVEAMREDAAGIPHSMLRADGGPTANRFLMQFIADITGVELRVGGSTDGSALGAAFAGLVGLGLLATKGAPLRSWAEDQVYTPAMEAERAGRLLAGWHQAVQSVLPAAAAAAGP